MAGYENRQWQSADGLNLHYRDYPGGEGKPPILCLPGLTRNARDFEEVAERLTGGWRVLAVDLRGRGDSDYARDSASYTPAVYVDDVLALLDSLALPSVVAFGTSLGGLMTMLLATRARERLAGALLNDIGPVIEPAGLARIRAQIGKVGSFPTWMHAARWLEEAQGALYPTYTVDDWLKMAKRLYYVNASGRIVLDYDVRIAEPFREPGGETAPDLWPALDALAGLPVTILRGARSDILSAATAAKMVARLPGSACVTVPDTGHAPTLAEPAAVAAIDRLLRRVAGEPAVA